jgi:hypothetical protein
MHFFFELEVLQRINRGIADEIDGNNAQDAHEQYKQAPPKPCAPGQFLMSP